MKKMKVLKSLQEKEDFKGNSLKKKREEP